MRVEDSWVGLRLKAPAYIEIQWTWGTNKGYLLLVCQCSVHSGTKTTSKTRRWLGEKLLPRWRVPVSQLPINLSSNSRKEQPEQGVEAQEVDVSPWVAPTEPGRFPRAGWPRQTQPNADGEAAIGEQLNHYTHAASLKIVTARAKAGPVVSCRPLWYTALAPNDSWPMVCQDFTSHLPWSPTCTEPGPFPLLPPPEALEEGINDDQDVSGHLHRSSPAGCKLAVHRHARTKRGVKAAVTELCWLCGEEEKKLTFIKSGL